MAQVTITGFKELNRVLDGIPKSITKRASLAAGRKAARPIVIEARSEIKNAPAETTGNHDGFQHLQALAKYTKVETYKNTVFVRVSRRAPDVPMPSRNRPFWNALNAAYLWAFGRQKEGKGSRFKRTGFTDGFGDWITNAGKVKMSEARNIYKSAISNEVEKAIQRTVRRYGK